MRFGVRLGPFWVSTSTRRRRRPAPGQRAKAERERREDEAAARVQQLGRMSAEEYQREAETDPAYRDWLTRREAATDAELQKLKDEGAGA